MVDHGLKKAIKFYLDKGWNIIPCDFKKAILSNGRIEKQVTFPIEYGKYHTERVTEEETNEWWGVHNGIAIVTGKISGITVMDIDTKALPEIQDLPKTFTVETNKGFHFYFRYKEELKTKAKLYEKDGFGFNIDLRNDGGIAYASPSEYELPDGTTSKYKVIDWSELAEFPLEWGQKIEAKYAKKPEYKDWKTKVLAPIELGKRNETFASIIGGLLRRFPQDEWNIAWTLVQSENAAQKDPLPEIEIRTIFNSIAKEELHKRNTGGEIKDIIIEENDEGIKIDIRLEDKIVCFKFKAFVAGEGWGLTWLKRAEGLSHEMSCYWKTSSDSSREQVARILCRAFDGDNREKSKMWTILVTKVCSELHKISQNKKRDFRVDEVVPKEVTWMLEPFIQEDQINTFFGMGSSGKTTMAMYFATMVAENGARTLLIDYENDVASWASKMKQMSEKKDFIYYDPEQTPIIEQVDKIKEVIKRHDIKLVIVDSASLASGDSTSDEKAALKLFAGLKLLKTTVILIAHQRKNEGDRNPIGSIQYENQARNVWNFASTPDDWEKTTLHVACKHTKANNTYLRKDPIGFKIIFDQGLRVEEESAINNFEDKFPIKKRIERLLNENPMEAKEIAKELGITYGTCRKNLSEGKNSGLFTQVEGKWATSVTQ